MEDGVWRTIGGRRIFIKKGQSLQSAMKESGKFNKATKTGTSQSIQDKYGLKDKRNEMTVKHYEDGDIDQQELKTELKLGGESQETISNVIKNNTGINSRDPKIRALFEEDTKPYNVGEAEAYYSKMSEKDIANDLEERKNRLDNDYYDEKDKAKYKGFYEEGKAFYDKKYGTNDWVKKAFAQYKKESPKNKTNNKRFQKTTKISSKLHFFLYNVII